MRSKGRRAIQITLTYVTRQASGNVARRSLEFAADRISIGRGTGCEVHLPDPRVLLTHAFIEQRNEDLFVAAALDTEIAVNGSPTSLARLRPGDRIAIGPYELTVGEPPQDKDLALDVELERPLGDAYADLLARSRMEFESVGLNKRGWSWCLIIAVAVVFLGGPLLVALEPLGDRTAARISGVTSETPKWLANADHLWLSGDISSAHRYFAEDCGVCHQRPFVPVEDSACVDCHRSVAHHADSSRFVFASLEDVACQSCHKEHNGIEAILLANQALCAECHAQPNEWPAKSDVQAVSDFDATHPEFRPTVIVDPSSPTVARQRLGGATPPRENSGLKFPHAEHLAEAGVKHPTKGTIKLGCGDCHQPEPNGLGMRPIRMQEHCVDCHALTFDPEAPDRQVPHGKPREAWAMLHDFYANRALERALEDAAVGAGERRLPRARASLSREEAESALDWARQRARVVAAETIGKRTCKTCHTVIPPATDAEPWGIGPVALSDSWLPNAKFSHPKHVQIQCVECHAAPQSKSAQDVLLPGVAQCQRCHGGEAAMDKVPSTCISCHDFHRPGLPPLRGRPGQQS